MVHPEQTNESIGFVGGVELQGQRYQYRCLLVRKKKNVHHSCRGGDDATKMCARRGLDLHNEKHESWRD